MSRSTHAMPGSPRGVSREKWLRIAAAIGVIGAIVLLSALRTPWVVESKGARDSGSAAAGSLNLNPDKYVASIWSTKILPTAKKDARDMSTLLADLKRDPAGTEKLYGHHAVEGAPPSFIVKGGGHVVSVDTSSLVSTAGIAFGSQSKPDILLQIGPILNGTDVRDAMPFINFNQFANQVQFGEVAIAINAKITNTAPLHLGTAKLKGKEVEFIGAYTPSSVGVPMVTPITLEVRK